MQFECPSCGGQLEVPDSYVGRRGRCHHCRTQVLVPSSAPATPADDEQALPPGVVRLDPGTEGEEYGCAHCGWFLSPPFPSRCSQCGSSIGFHPQPAPNSQTVSPSPAEADASPTPPDNEPASPNTRPRWHEYPSATLIFLKDNLTWTLIAVGCLVAWRLAAAMAFVRHPEDATSLTPLALYIPLAAVVACAALAVVWAASRIPTARIVRRPVFFLIVWIGVTAIPVAVGPISYNRFADQCALRAVSMLELRLQNQFGEDWFSPQPELEAMTAQHHDLWLLARMVMEVSSTSAAKVLRPVALLVALGMKPSEIQSFAATEAFDSQWPSQTEDSVIGVAVWTARSRLLQEKSLQEVARILDVDPEPDKLVAAARASEEANEKIAQQQRVEAERKRVADSYAAALRRGQPQYGAEQSDADFQRSLAKTKFGGMSASEVEAYYSAAQRNLQVCEMRERTFLQGGGTVGSRSHQDVQDELSRAKQELSFWSRYEQFLSRNPSYGR